MVATIKTYQRTETLNAINPVGVKAPTADLSPIAQGVAAVGDTAFAWQDEIDTASAKQADNQYSELIRQELYADQTGFMYSEGGNAIDRRGTVSERLEAEQKRLLEGLHPRARARAGSALTARYQRSLQQIDQHTATQRGVYLNGAAEARVTSSINDAIYNPDQIGQSLSINRQEITDMAAREGWSPEVTALKLKQSETAIHSGIIGRIETADPVAALEYLRSNRDKMSGDEVSRLESALMPRVKQYSGRQIARRLLGGGAEVSMGTRDVNAPSASVTNISMDFNASVQGGARGTEVIIPDNAPPAMRAAAEEFNARVVAFAAKHGINHPNRGVKTRSENGRGVNNTVHAEPFFNDNMELQRAISGNLGEFAQIYQDTFGQLDGVRIIPPHGVGADRGAASEVFGNETAFGKRIAQSLIDGKTSASGDLMAMSQIVDIVDPDERAAALSEFKLLAGVRDAADEALRESARQAAFGLIVDGGSVDDLTSDMQKTIGISGMASLRSYADTVSSGGTVKTDMQAYVALSDIAASDPDAFIVMDPMTWRDKLDDGDFEFFVKKRADIMAGKRGKPEDAPDVSAIRTASSTALKAAGLDKDFEEVAKFESEMLRWSSEFVKAEGRKPNPSEMNDRINQMLVPLVIKPANGKRSGPISFIWGGGKVDARQFQVDWAGDAKSADDDLTPEDVRDGRLSIDGNVIENQTIEWFAQAYEDRFKKAPSVSELVEGIIASGAYQ